MANMLSSLNERILAEGNFTPFDVLFSNYFVPDEASTEYADVRLWYPLSNKTRDVLTEVLEGIEDKMVRNVIALAYGFRDGEYHSINDIQETLGVPIALVYGSICILSRHLFDAREAVYATISDEAREEIKRGCMLSDFYPWEGTRGL